MSVTGETAGFTIEARDAFANLRSGESTDHIAEYGDGSSDYFLVKFAGPGGYEFVTSSAVEVITGLYTFGNFSLELVGVETVSMPLDVSAGGLESALEEASGIDVSVSRSAEGNGYAWTVTFLDSLADLMAAPLALSATSDATVLSIERTGRRRPLPDRVRAVGHGRVRGLGHGERRRHRGLAVRHDGARRRGSAPSTTAVSVPTAFSAGPRRASRASPSSSACRCAT